MTNTALSIHSDAIIIDAVAPILERREYLDLYVKAGVTAVAPTVGGNLAADATVKHLGEWLRFVDTRSDVILVRTARDIETAKRDGKIGLIFHFQGTEPFDNDLNLVEAYQALGVRMVQLTYNVKNRVGDGCDERTDAGLSQFGVDLISRLNANGIVVDCSHTGYRTTLEAMEVSKHPVVFSHANAKALFNSARNITDDQARAIARTGGLIGVNAVSFFLTHQGRPDIEQVLDHIDYFVKLIGIDHVAIGLDFWWGLQPFVSDAEADQMWQKYVASGMWKPETYPRPPNYYPQGLETPAELPNLTHGLVARGYDAGDCRKIMGENWMRVFRSVWGE